MTGFWRTEVFEDVPSTQDIVRARAEAGEAEGLVIQALCQSRGRGRLGAVWESPPGNLYLSVLLRPDIPAARVGEMAFVCALALAAAFESFTGGRDLWLKWPNDVLLDGQKVSGILIETAIKGDRPDYVIVGIGVNIAAPPPGAAALSPETGREDLPDPLHMREAILDRLSFYLQKWLREGFTPIRAAWLPRAAGLGGPIRVRRASGLLTGIFRDIDSDGALILEKSSGRCERICAGDILMPLPQERF